MFNAGQGAPLNSDPRENGSLIATAEILQPGDIPEGPPEVLLDENVVVIPEVAPEFTELPLRRAGGGGGGLSQRPRVGGHGNGMRQSSDWSERTERTAKPTG